MPYEIQFLFDDQQKAIAQGSIRTVQSATEARAIIREQIQRDAPKFVTVRHNGKLLSDQEVEELIRSPS